MAASKRGHGDETTSEASALDGEGSKGGGPEGTDILPRIMSKGQWGPVVRRGDGLWANVVQWSLFAWLNAEGLGVTQGNVEEMRDSPNPQVRRLLGVEGDYGKGVRLEPTWAYAIVKHVGNYGESFERNIGKGSRLNIARGYNRLWTNGGLHYAPPFR